MTQHTPLVNILGIFSEPKGTDPLQLQLDQRAIQNCIKMVKCRDWIEFECLAAATIMMSTEHY